MSKVIADQVIAEYGSFEECVPDEFRFTREQQKTMQVNIGYRCNISCKHCHLSCGPHRTEKMSREVMQACIDAYKACGFTSMDITGGAPEMHPDFEWFLRLLSAEGIKPICRTNLCVLTDPAYAHIGDLYAELDVQLSASLPYYAPGNCDKIRGKGTFDANIKALKRLNELGYGTGKHSLTLVYNPSGAVLPAGQASMEKEFKEKFLTDYGVHFDNLIAIANNPTGRFAEALHAKNRLGSYMDRLIGAFNPGTCEGMMCRDQISVDYNGRVYDCDFNQALGLEIEGGATIFDFAHQGSPGKRHIVFGNHCYACTAGAGSSCGGATA